MAGSLNRVMLIGRLGKDPELQYTQSGQPVCSMSLATDESYKDRDGNKVDRVEWHRVKVFGRSAEFCGNYLGKGRLVYVEGTLRTRSWEDQQGQKRYMTEVVVTGPSHTIQGLDSRGQGDGGQHEGPRQDAPRRQASGGRGRQAQDEGDGPAFPSEASGMDDVPF